MQLRAVLFDLWETLIHDTPERAQPRRVWRLTGVLDALLRHGFDGNPEDVQAALDATSSALNTLHDSGIDLGSEGRAQLLLEHIESRTGSRPPQSSVSDIEEIVTAMPLDKAPVLMPHAVETLTSLKAMGASTGLVSNAGFTTAPHLRVMLEHYGLLPLLDVLVFSDELKRAKPDARVFAAALDALGLRAADCAFVGDNPHTDIHGAQAAGLFAVLIGAKYRDGVTPDVHIDTLDQLIPRLRTIDRLATI